MISTQQRCAPVPKASECGSPHYDSATAVGGGWPKVVRGRWRRKRHGAAFQGPPARRPGLARKGGDWYSPRRRRQRESISSVAPRPGLDRRQARHSRPAPPSSSPTDTWCQVRIDRQQTASTNGRPLEAAGPATMISTQQRARRCQRHPNAAHPTTTPRQAVGGGRPKVVRGRRRRESPGVAIQGHST
ncbi:hypothetical protein H4582DRAFT_2063252 [Lactarius indigo]|nr:hypothetical protein H4582DRAFT_2063252 [Lactarius indigo]